MRSSWVQAPRDGPIPGRKEAAKNIHISIDWLSSVSFGRGKIGKRVAVLGGGSTAMDCCCSAPPPRRRQMDVVVRSASKK